MFLLISDNHKIVLYTYSNPTGSMINAFTPSLDRQDVYGNGHELATILGRDRDPQGNRIRTYPKTEKARVVSFDHPVLVTDNYRIGQLPPAMRDTVFALFAQPVRTTVYDGTTMELDHRAYPGVWGPSIDTLLFCRAIRDDGLDKVRSVVEAGNGTGWISLYLRDHCPNLETLSGVDLDPNAQRCAKVMVPDPRATFYIGDAKDFLTGKKVDLIVCNPPYIPRPGSIDDNPYEGISLLHYLVANAPQSLTRNGRIVTNVSSLCKHIFDGAFEHAPVRARVLDQMQVPLKVYNVLNNPEWMQFLLGRGLTKNPHDGYEYWHTIRITEIRPK
jgi:hypothetical protein